MAKPPVAGTEHLQAVSIRLFLYPSLRRPPILPYSVSREAGQRWLELPHAQTVCRHLHALWRRSWFMAHSGAFLALPMGPGWRGPFSVCLDRRQLVDVLPVWVRGQSHLGPRLPVAASHFSGPGGHSGGCFIWCRPNCCDLLGCATRVARKTFVVFGKLRLRHRF